MQLQADEADHQLLSFLDSFEESLAESRERTIAEGLDPEIAQRFDELTGVDDAPLEWRSLHRRVREGRLSWQDVWLDPLEQPGGADLIDAVMKAEAAALKEILRRFDEDGPEPNAPSGGVLR